MSTATHNLPASDRHLCPPWVGYLLVCPLRRLFESPERILGPHVRPGMTVLEPGCAMGYFTLPLARIVGPEGRVLCTEIQPRMLERLEKRARAAGLEDRIEASLTSATDLGLERWTTQVDFVAALHVIHEMADPRRSLDQLYAMLRPGGRMLVLEPRGHVSDDRFALSLEQARGVGFVELAPPQVPRNHVALLEKR